MKNENKYEPNLALKNAVKAWLPYIYTSVGTEGITPTSFENTDFEQHKKKLKKRLSDDLINEKDLLLLAELFYLPEEYGSVGLHLLSEASWLLNNADSVNRTDSDSVDTDSTKIVRSIKITKRIHSKLFSFLCSTWKKNIGIKEL